MNEWNGRGSIISAPHLSKESPTLEDKTIMFVKKNKKKNA